MAKRTASAVQLTSYDDIFGGSSESEASAAADQIVQVEIKQLVEFPDHPFRVEDDEELEKLVDSIKENGVMNPILVMPKEDGYYVISGHRRWTAAQKAGLSTIPAIVKQDINMAQATILMVDTNIYREHISPSEKAHAYFMKMEAIRELRQSGDASQFGTQRTDEIIAAQTGTSRNQVQRYVRLNNLAPELLQMVDDGKIAVNAAVPLSYLTNEEQDKVAAEIKDINKYPTIEQATTLKEKMEAGNVKEGTIRSILEGEKIFDQSDLPELFTALSEKLVAWNDAIAIFFTAKYDKRVTAEEVKDYLPEILKHVEDTHIYCSGSGFGFDTKIKNDKIQFLYRRKVVLESSTSEMIPTLCDELQKKLKKNQFAIFSKKLAEAYLANHYSLCANNQSTDDWIATSGKMKFEFDGIEMTSAVNKTTKIVTFGTWNKTYCTQIERLVDYFEANEAKIVCVAAEIATNRVEKENQELAFAKEQAELVANSFRERYKLFLCSERYTAAQVEDAEREAAMNHNELLVDALEMMRKQISRESHILDKQPALPQMKRNEISDWLNDSHTTWPIWRIEPDINTTYYRYCLYDGSQIIAQDYDYLNYNGEVLSRTKWFFVGNGQVGLWNHESYANQIMEHVATSMKEQQKYQLQHPEEFLSVTHNEIQMS